MIKEEKMLHNPGRLAISLVVTAVCLAAAPMAAAQTSVPTPERTDVKIQTQNPIGAPQPRFTLRSLVPSHAGDIKPYVPIPDTADTHAMQVESK
jgi:hypothetical protein